MPFMPPMLATRLDDPRRLADPRYIAEPKLDGQGAQVMCATSPRSRAPNVRCGIRRPSSTRYVTVTAPRTGRSPP